MTFAAWIPGRDRHATRPKADYNRRAQAGDWASDSLQTTKEFLMRFGLKDVNELPSMEEFEKLVPKLQSELIGGEFFADGRECNTRRGTGERECVGN